MPTRWSFLPCSRFRTAWKLAVAVATLLLLAGGAGAQVSPYTFERNGTRRVKMPFEFQRNLIVVPVYLNGQGPYNFLLDTGVATSLITDPKLRETLNLKIGGEFRVAGLGEDEPLLAYRTDGVAVTMNGVVGPSITFLVLSNDVLNLSGYVGMTIHGILGFDVFRSFVVEVDPMEPALIFHDPKRYRQPKGRRWTRVPLELEGSKAYMTVPVTLQDTLTLPLKLILDTGAGHALSIETHSDPRLKVPAQRLRTQLGRGLSGNINGFLGRVGGLQLGQYRLTSPLTSFPDSSNVVLRTDANRNGNVGFEMLKRFRLVIDYPHNRLLLRPNALFHDPFEHDMCGFELLASGPDFRRYIVLKVHPNSPASAAGLQTNDEILSVNLQPVAGMNLTQISRLFHSADGRQLLLIVRRADGELRTTTVKLKRQI
ncbi:aspartyl protease family protein [Hymenobacter sp. BT175]|uniref:aspartyl protease family protein n=1 Tax=Hymenobacter translucens TaxID=2886507 RepID=UPI001D0E3EA7|nr:aspartyl protease family protein [Hymenobacter translucens]MCC2546681.1 aspartyl protease family protein [Hymenobacter translucens]